MRSILVTLMIFGAIPFAVVRPFVGLCLYFWISYMNPHRLTYGFAETFPFALIAGAVTIAAWLMSKEPKKLPMNFGTGLMIGFAVWISLTTLFALVPDQAVPTWIQAVKILLMTFLTMILVTSRARLDALIWTIVVSIGYFAVKGGLFTLATGGTYRVYGPPDSMIADNNSFALATIITVPLARYLQMQVKNRWVKWSLLCSIVLMIISAAGSYSRGALLSLTVMAMFMWMKSRGKIVLGVGIVTVALVGLAFMPEQWFHRMDTMKTYEEDNSALSRFNSWTFAYNFAVDHPILGGGFDVFSDDKLWPRYAPNPEDKHNAHSIYFEVLATHGFPGLAMFLLICAAAFRHGSWVIRRTKARPDLFWARDIAAMTQCSLLGFTVGGAFLNLAFFDLFWHLIAILILVQVMVKREIATANVVAERAVLPAIAPAMASASGAIVASAPVRSFLRRSAPRTVSKSFLRQR